jgi:hypothetical protein
MVVSRAAAAPAMSPAAAVQQTDLPHQIVSPTVANAAKGGFIPT